jgi:hypothetical protein
LEILKSHDTKALAAEVDMTKSLEDLESLSEQFRMELENKKQAHVSLLAKEREKTSNEYSEFLAKVIKDKINWAQKLASES